jgi:hypothetical protein
VSWFVHAVPASPQRTPSEAWLTWQAPEPLQVSEASHCPERRIAARRAGGLEAVVVAGAREARVLVRALRARVAARGPVGDVIDLA